MNFPINSASENKKYLTVPSKTAVQNDIQKNPPPAAKKQNNNSTKIWAGLVALAVIGMASAAIYRARSNKSETLNPVQDTKQIIKDLKVKIKTDYLNRKAEILNAHKKDSVDENEIKKYIDMKQEASDSIKTVLKNLQQDSEWQELRKIRKSLLKTLCSNKNGEQYNIASKKIELINNILTCKLHPEQIQAFKDNTLMDISDAAEIVRKPFNTIKEFEKEYAAKQKYEFDFNLDDKLFFTNSNLSLRDIFTEEMKKYDFAKEKISELKLEPKKKLHEELTKLAEEFHSCEDVKKLKNLNGTDKQTSPVIA